MDSKIFLKFCHCVCAKLKMKKKFELNQSNSNYHETLCIDTK